MWGLKVLLDELLDLDSLYTQKDCRHLYEKIEDGIYQRKQYDG